MEEHQEHRRKTGQSLRHKGKQYRHHADVEDSTVEGYQGPVLSFNAPSFHCHFTWDQWVCWCSKKYVTFVTSGLYSVIVPLIWTVGWRKELPPKLCLLRHSYICYTVLCLPFGILLCWVPMLTMEVWELWLRRCTPHAWCWVSLVYDSGGFMLTVVFHFVLSAF